MESLDALNAWLEDRCRVLWEQTPHGRGPGTIADAWAEEVESLMPLGRLFGGFVEYRKRVSPTCLVHLDRSRYRRFGRGRISLCLHQRDAEARCCNFHSCYIVGVRRKYFGVIFAFPAALSDEAIEAARRLEQHVVRRRR